MEKIINNSESCNQYYVYEPGYREKKCIEKLSDIAHEFQNVMDSDEELQDLKKQIEDLNKKYNRYNGDEYDAC